MITRHSGAHATAALAQISSFYEAELKSLVRLVVDDAPIDQITRARNALVEISKQWNAVHWEVHHAPRAPLNTRAYSFTRGAAQYECTCDAPGEGDPTWTIRRNGCEVSGPVSTGTEFSNGVRAQAFEQMAVAAVEACTKPCALAG